MMLFLNVIYVLIAIAMIALILMQRGAGAQAGSGFGSGASGTVFGARGASNFLSKSTKWLAIAFFTISLFMAWQASVGNRTQTGAKPAGGLMSEIPAAPAQPASGSAVPSAPATAPAAAPAVPASAPATVPSAPVGEGAPAPAAEPAPASQDAPATTPPQG